MPHTARIAAAFAAGIWTLAITAAAQEPVASFDRLAEDIQVGQSVWVTDSSGREVRGRLLRLAGDELVLEADGRQTYAASDVRRVRTRDRDPLKNGALVGLGIGGGMATAWCVGAIADDSGEVDARVECAEGFTVFPGLGALIGLAVDAVIPGKMRVIYQAASPQGVPRARLMVAPVVSARVKGLSVSWTF